MPVKTQAFPECLAAAEGLLALYRSGPSQPYELSPLNSPSVNAFSTAAGKVYVDSGMLPYIEKNPGLWAAVLSHELGHCVGQYQYHA
jgi:predicted Zn-dependent protease